jgi:hypothetical protein
VRVEIRCRWESHHVVEVPDDFKDTGRLSDFPEDVLEELTPLTAEMMDWWVYFR